MSSLTTTTINTIDGSTDLTLQTGNSAAARIVIDSTTEGIILGGNSSVNAVSVNSLAVNVSTNTTFTKNVSVLGTTTLNAISNGASFSGNTTFGNVVATRVFSTNATLSSNSLVLGTASIATSGYTRIPNGLLMQWGTVTSNSSAGTITFPAAFAAAPYSVIVTPQSNTGANSAGAVTFTNTTAAFVRTANATSYTFYYLALGV